MLCGANQKGASLEGEVTVVLTISDSFLVVRVS